MKKITKNLQPILSLVLISVIVVGAFEGGAIRKGARSVLIFETGLDDFEGFEDTTIYSESENSGGGVTGVFSGTIRNNPFDRRAMFWIDLTSIAPVATVEEVSLELMVNRSGADFGDVDFSLHRLLKDWGEGDTITNDPGGVGAPADEGDATWVSNFHGTSAWDTPGGDFVAEPSAVAPAGREFEMAVWSGPGLVADVQAWIDKPETNFGWILISSIEGELQKVKRFYSSESNVGRPRLVVTASGLPAVGCPGAKGRR